MKCLQAGSYGRETCDAITQSEGVTAIHSPAECVIGTQTKVQKRCKWSWPFCCHIQRILTEPPALHGQHYSHLWPFIQSQTRQGKEKPCRRTSASKFLLSAHKHS